MRAPATNSMAGTVAEPEPFVNPGGPSCWNAAV